MIGFIVNSIFGPATVTGPDGFYVHGPFMFVATVVACVLFLFIAPLTWLYHDAKRRGKNGVLAMLLIVLTGWPLSFIWWFWLRPPLKDPVAPPANDAIPAGALLFK